jgi:hypothetical protein
VFNDLPSSQDRILGPETDFGDAFAFDANMPYDPLFGLMGTADLDLDLLSPG